MSIILKSKRKERVMEVKYISQSEIIKSRNWTIGLIKKHLIEPDLIKSNPHYKGSNKMRLFLLERVDLIENSSEFMSDYEKSIKRKENSLKMIKTKTDNLIDSITHLEIVLEKIENKRLLNYAIDHYNSRNFWNWMEKNSLDAKTKERLIVNYIRHELTSYECVLGALKCKVGKLKGYELLNRKIYDKIGEIYPFLKKECLNQMNNKLQRMRLDRNF